MSTETGTRTGRLRGLRARLRQSLRDNRGVAAVEFAFVLPIIILLLAGVIQFGMLLFLQNHMTNVARETSRRVAVGELTKDEAKSEAECDLVNWGISYDVDVTVPDGSDPDDKDIIVTISAPMSEASLIDILGIFGEGKLQTAVTMRQE